MADELVSGGGPKQRPSKNEALRYKYTTIRKQLALAANASKGQLRPWHKQFALWYATNSVLATPRIDECVAQAQRITRQSIPRTVMHRLLLNPAFQALAHQYQEEEVAKARAIMEERTPKAVEHHFDALDELMKREQFDKVFQFTKPILERVWPAEQPRLPAQVITINIGGEFAERHKGKLDKDPVEIIGVAEVVEETPT